MIEGLAEQALAKLRVDKAIPEEIPDNVLWVTLSAGDLRDAMLALQEGT